MADDAKPDPPAKDDDKKDPPGGTDDLGDAGKRALDAERKARRDAERKATDLENRLKAIEDKDKSDSERLAEENQRLTRDLAAATVNGARLKVALDKGLSVTQAKRLVGESEEDLTADAEELLADLGAKPGDRPDPPGNRRDFKPGTGDPDVPVEETDVKKLGERMFSR